MSYPINYPTPQGANVQIFKEGGSTSDWVKPQGASFVWFTLIGAGGGGGGVDATNAYYGAGGGSGAVTNFMGPAFLMPDVLRVSVGRGGTAGNTAVSGGSGTPSTVIYQAKDDTGYTLLTANAGAGGDAAGGGSDASAALGGNASTNNFFTASGFFNSVAGQDSTTASAAQTASATTFLAGGTAGTSSTGNYGYVATGRGNAGFFQMQPIIVGVSNPGTSANTNKSAIGCGGASNFSLGVCGSGGDGMVVIITW
jgi:hypothetical protein